MNVELFLHGVPYGQDHWGTTNDTYYDKFYSSSQDVGAPVLSAEVQQYDNHLYAYYTYTVRGLNDCNGRSGSYFGITLRCDAYCADILGIFRMLDVVYNRYIIGGILQLNNGKISYLNSNFKSVEGQIETIRNVVFKFIEIYINPKEFVALDKTFLERKVKQWINPLDILRGELSKDELKKYSILNVSYAVSTVKEINLSKQIDSNSQKDREAAFKLEQSISDIKKKNVLLDQELKNKITLIEQLELQNRDLQKQCAEHYDLTSIVSQINEPITKLAKILSQNDTAINNKGLQNLERLSILNKVKDKKNFIILTIVVFILLFAMWCLISPTHKIAKAKETIELLDSTIVDLRGKNQLISKQLAIYEENKHSSILVKELNNCLIKDEVYTLKINASGGEYQCYPKSAGRFEEDKFTPIKVGNVRIDYTIDGLCIASVEYDVKRTIKRKR